MASGTAYRWDEPAREVLNLYPDLRPRKAEVKLYKASPSRRASNNKPPSTFRLGELPPELLCQVLLSLDLNSLGMLRRVNTTTRSLVESLPEYFLLRKHASYTLRIMDATRCTSYFPIRWIYQELCHPRCRTCSDFGPFLYLPTITRSCFKCSISRPEYQVAPTSDVMFHFGISRKDLKSIPIIYPLPGDWNKQRRVDVAQARALGLRLHGSLKKMNEGFRTRLKKRREKEDLARSKWREDVWRGSERREPRYRYIPMNLVDCFQASVWRLMGTTSFPYWDRQKRALEPGIYCRACTYRYEEREGGAYRQCHRWRSQPESKKAYNRAFLQADLPKHFLHCPAVKANYDFGDRKGLIKWPFRRSGTDFIVNANGTVFKNKTAGQGGKNQQNLLEGRKKKLKTKKQNIKPKKGQSTASARCHNQTAG